MQIELKTNNVLKKIHLICALLLFATLSNLTFAESSLEDSHKNKIEKLIHVGDSYSDVLKALGKPTSDDLIMKKELPAIVGRRLRYIYKQQNESSFNPGTDSYITLWFSSEDILLDINYHK